MPNSNKNQELRAINGILGLASLITVLSIVYLLNAHHQDYTKISHLTSPFKTQTKVKKEKPKVVLPEPTDLMPQKNHNNAAKSYAYDTAEIRDYITGQKNYEGKKLVFLTIDDGANQTITPQVLDVLKAHQVPATFFVIGATVYDENAEIFKRQIKEGHALALHSMYHSFATLYPNAIPNPPQILAEAQEGHQLLQTILGTDFKTRVWRYPGGAMSWQGLEESHSLLAQNGFEWIDWNANVGDAEQFRPQTVEEMVAFQTNSYQHFPESNVRVVLMHDTEGKELTLASLPQIIQYYKDQGYEFGVLN